jgi:hypothetical protein
LREDDYAKDCIFRGRQYGFAKNLMGDILGFPELAEATLSLHDIDGERLRTSEVVAHKVAEAVDAHPVIEATLDRMDATLDRIITKQELLFWGIVLTLEITVGALIVTCWH